ncbi:hypothetical protein ACIQVU_16575 [Lysinibacillus sp. NPDC098008]|uniref:hypothetical protein n=1 Tax=Lysinibacillus sp. NPDC098008 TaxID=3364146 RepID=UPI00382D71BC
MLVFKSELDLELINDNEDYDLIFKCHIKRLIQNNQKILSSGEELVIIVGRLDKEPEGYSLIWEDEKEIGNKKYEESFYRKGNKGILIYNICKEGL